MPWHRITTATDCLLYEWLPWQGTAYISIISNGLFILVTVNMTTDYLSYSNDYQDNAISNVCINTSWWYLVITTQLYSNKDKYLMGVLSDRKIRNEPNVFVIEVNKDERCKHQHACESVPAKRFCTSCKAKKFKKIPSCIIISSTNQQTKYVALNDTLFLSHSLHKMIANSCHNIEYLRGYRRDKSTLIFLLIQYQYTE